MPTYDYICHNCQQKFDVFMSYDEYGKKPVHCIHCGSDNVKRRVNRIRIAKSEERRMESMLDGPGDLAELEKDPQALGQMMRKMGKEMGEELPAEFDEVVGRLESGQSPEEIESALPDIGGNDAGTDDL
jgi:putative FmdB family regulatory protein